MNGRSAVADTERRIDKHLLFSPATPEEPEHGYFNRDRRLNTITTTDLTAYTARRIEQGASAASCNHELATVKRAFRLALRAGEIVSMPYIPMLKLHNVREGFFERDQFEAAREALPEALRGVMTFAYLTGWRVRSEVLPLKWAQVNRTAKTIRLEPGTTKNREGRTLPYDLLPELVEVIDEQWQEHERLKSEDRICPHVFHRNGKPIRDLRGAWESACKAAGCPG
jgi:integrase